jgi:hypothetical protein
MPSLKTPAAESHIAALGGPGSRQRDLHGETGTLDGPWGLIVTAPIAYVRREIYTPGVYPVKRHLTPPQPRPLAPREAEGS